MRDGPFADWFDARALYRDGVPEEVSTAIESFPGIRAEVEDAIAALAPRAVLEVGPGRAPLAASAPRVFYLDLAEVFLAPHRGRAVQGDVLRAPFRDRAFDLVVAADVFTHIPPRERRRALAEMARVGRQVAIFNPEPGTPEVRGSAVPTDDLVRALASRGLAVQRREFRARAAGRPDFVMALLLARGL